LEGHLSPEHLVEIVQYPERQCSGSVWASDVGDKVHTVHGGVADSGGAHNPESLPSAPPRKDAFDYNMRGTSTNIVVVSVYERLAFNGSTNSLTSQGLVLDSRGCCRPDCQHLGFYRMIRAIAQLNAGGYTSNSVATKRATPLMIWSRTSETSN
jgi:hypothetical protein